MDKEEKRALRRKRLMANKVYQAMGSVTRYMDRYYLDALMGFVPGWGDAIALLSVVPFVYFSSRVIRSIPLTLAVLNTEDNLTNFGLVASGGVISVIPITLFVIFAQNYLISGLSSGAVKG